MRRGVAAVARSFSFRRRESCRRARKTSSRSRSAATKSSSKARPRATHSPFSLNMKDWPSKISSSWPPTAFTKARHTRSSAARVASIFSRKRPLPEW